MYQFQKKSLNASNLVKRTEEREIRIRTLSSKSKLVKQNEDLNFKKMRIMGDSTSDNVSRGSLSG